MSKIALSGPASGTATYTISAPTGATDRTITLPDQTGTLLTGSGAIGVNSSAATNSLVIDASGNVGIGTSSPAYKLDVTASSFIAASFSTSYSGAGNIRIADASTTSASAPYIGSVGNNLTFGRLGTAEYARIDSSGNLLVGTTSTASYGAGIGRLYLSASGANWQVGPTSAFANFYIKAGTGYGVGMTTTATSWSSDSDERKKTALTPFANAAEKVCSLRAGTGRYLTDEENMSRSFLIAQDVQAVLPEAVDVGEDEDQSLMLRYTDLIPLLTAAIQEQQAIITALTARVTALEGTQP